MAEAASSYVTLIPSMSGFKKAATPTIEATGDEGGALAGAAAGKSFAAKFKSFLTSGKTLATGAIVAGATAAVKGLYNIGATFDDVSDTIRTGTGATGKDLDGLVQVAKNVGTNVPEQFDKIGPVVADLNTRLGLSGKTLQTVSEQYLQAGHILGQDVDIKSTTAAFTAFGIKGADVSKAMDDLFRVSQATGVGMNELSSIVQSQAPTMKNLGFTFADTTSLIGSLDKAGVNTQQVMASMSKGLVTLAKSGEDPKKAFADVTAEVEKYVQTGNTTAAINVASKIFGTRGAAQFVGAVQSGKLAVSDLMAATGATGDTILGVADDTADLAESWQVLKNKALVAIQPVASKTFDLLSTGVKKVADGFDPAIAAGQKFYSKFLDLSAGSGSALDRLHSGLTMTSKDAADFADSLADDKVMAFGQNVRKSFDTAKSAIAATAAPLQKQLSASWGQAPAGVVLSWSDILYNGAGLAMNKASGAIKSAGATIKSTFSSLVSAAGPGVTQLINTISTLAKQFGPQLLQVLSAFSPVKLIFEALKPLLPQIGALVGQLASILGGALSQALTALAPVFSTVTGIISQLIPFITQLVASLLPPLSDLIQKLAPLLSTVLAAVTPIIDAIASALIPILNALMPVVETVFGFLATTIQNAMKVLGGLIDFITGIFSGNWSKAWSGIKEIFSGVWNEIKSVVSTATELIKSVTAAAWSVIKGAASVAWTAIKTVILTPMQALQTGISTAISGVSKFLSGVWDGIKSSAKTAWNLVHDYVVNPLKTAYNWVVDTFSKIGTTISNAVSGVVDFIKKPINAVIDGVNWVIRQLNKMSFKVPSWVPVIGGKGFGFDISEIPHLALGGLVSTPTLAVVGDSGPGNPEIVAPQKMIRDIIRQESRQQDSSALTSRLDELTTTVRWLAGQFDSSIQGAQRRSQTNGRTGVFA